MNSFDNANKNILDFAQVLTESGEPFAYATIIRTAGATSAKPGAKAIVSSDGQILKGWIGGGCIRTSVAKATITAIETGSPQLISVMPQDAIDEIGIRVGDEYDGKKVSRNGCPSEGTVDIFIEPYTPAHQLVIYGKAPVAEALKKLAPQFGWATEIANEDSEPNISGALVVTVVATQGNKDLKALSAAINSRPAFISFVGSKKKFSSLKAKLLKSGCAETDLRKVKAPAGLDIGAVTPEEISLSILAELLQVRKNFRNGVYDEDS
jgi:xanthine dehydrogenase accessory factor